jgi:putative hydrolase of the HAD superfamily
VVFDVGGVLERVDDDAWPELFVRRWERRAGLQPGAFETRLAEHDPGGSVVTGEVTEREMRAMYAAALGLDDAAADTMMAELWDVYCGRLDVELRDFAAGLRPSYTTAILSNSADGARREEQRRYGFEQLVDVIVYSHEVGLAKPDPAIYALTAERLGAHPHEIVFLDDHEEPVAAARRLGWHGVLHRDTPDSIRAVNEILAAQVGG